MMKRLSLILLAIGALAIGALACVRQQGSPAPAAGPPVDSRRELIHDGRTRTYYLHVPRSHDWTRPAPLVMVFHGGGGKAQNAIRTTRFNDLADEEGFIVVYPNGTGPRDLNVEVFTWNGGTCCGNAMLENADDVGFARAVLADVRSIAAVDGKRVYAAGLSNGGIMAYRLACEAADVFAAIGSVAGTLNYAPCKPSRPISVIHFHGTADEHLPYEGGYGPQSIVQVNFASVRDTIKTWLALNDCAPPPRLEEFDNIRHETWGGCSGGSSVELYTIIGGQHAWPGADDPAWAGGDEPTQTISATQLIWEFFKSHPMP